MSTREDEAQALTDDDRQKAAFYSAWDEFTKNCGHNPAHFDVWLMAVGCMDVTGRRRTKGDESVLRDADLRLDMEQALRQALHVRGPAGHDAVVEEFWLRFDAARQDQVAALAHPSQTGAK